MKEIVKFAASMILVSLVTAGMIYLAYQMGYQVAKNEQQPAIIYQVDNAGSEMVGQITDKEIIEGRYTVTASAYGKFLVTKEQYEAIKVGDPIPDYLKKRGSFSRNTISSRSAASPSARTAALATMFASNLSARATTAARDSPVLITSSTISTFLPRS